ncbi:MAG: mobile mystery protein A [Candidatus Marinimicrobia bacterium]|nr:mobile mystery protein A [Candidatus Neomarinimicrobiota bacterium]
MDISKQRLLIEHADQKLAVFKPLNSITIPQKGWIHIIRVALRMSLRQLGNRLKISPQSVKEMEERESNGSITIKGLKEVGAVLNMKLIYGFIPEEESIEKMIEKQALEIAKDIVLRTSNTMQLEDQENSNARIEKAISNRAEDIKMKMPTYLWD